MSKIKTGRLGHAIPDSSIVQSLVLAMNKDLCVSFEYEGKQRIVEVHAIGTSTKDGEVLMRGYQVAGSASRPLPQWTLFRTEKMGALTLTFTESHAPREGYAQGDAQFDELIAELVL